MTTLIANELLKLRTIRSPWLLVALTQLIIVMGVSGVFIGGADATAAGTPIGAVGHAGLLSLFTLVLGITAVAGEYRHKTITDSYLATPPARPTDRREARRLHSVRDRLRPPQRAHRPDCVRRVACRQRR
ncbi:hypothetical protein [Pengzhenrongella frigida]|uniref:ABC transporter permease n=1 Tax=Pengzhenrongella frigida TaxID=1259133 RepID=A0A4Q5MVE0_9MICO|nr:hypothetical protein [Cellulomonas sp. HLT2-17]RYV49556.1 hypothetical protein EUA98_18170 [Cellulomonas sp. HLT2-17]